MSETVESEADPLAEAEGEDELENEDSVTELLEQLARQLSGLAVDETRAAAARHEPELRRAARDVAAALGAVLAFLTAFALANAAAVYALSTALPDWAAALVLAAVWAVGGTMLALYLRARAKRATERREGDAEIARVEMEEALRDTLERLAAALSREIALAAVPVAGDIATGVVDAGDELIESADDMVESIADDLPGGGLVNQVWDVALFPGRLGIRVATTVLKRVDSP